MHELWYEFTKTHQELAADPQFRNHRYFTSDYYNQVKHGVDHLQEKINNNMQKLRVSPPDPAPEPTEDASMSFQADQYDSENSEEFEAAGGGERDKVSPAVTKTHDQKQHDPAHAWDFLAKPVVPQQQSNQKLIGSINKQKSMFKMLVHFIQQIRAQSSEQHSKQYYELKLVNITSYWSTITGTNLTIWEQADIDSNQINYKLEDYYALEDRVHQTTLELSEKLAAFQVHPNPTHHQHQHQDAKSYINLPKVTIPTFDGDYLKWGQFYDIYNRMIHTAAISNADKMFYLNSNLTGEAKALVQHLPITSENYSSAWKIITNRYNNKRIVTTALLNKLLSQPNSQQESASAIRSLHDVTTVIWA